MSDEEFDVLDELYFVQSFSDLLILTEKSADQLAPVLKSLYEKGWIKVMENVDDEIPKDKLDFDSLQNQESFFLATKNGLMAHNTQ